MQLRFLGGAGAVGGSKLLVEHEGRRLLLDCGLFQGLKQLRLHNRSPLGVASRSIDAVVLTRAHGAHCGFLPRLVELGFDAPVYASPATVQLCRLLLPESGRALEQEAQLANALGYGKHVPAQPLYTEAAARRALQLLRPCPFDAEFAPVPGFTMRLRRCGQSLGAASVQLHCGSHALRYAGTLGRQDDPLLRPPASAEAAELLLLEATHGQREYRSAEALARLARLVHRTAARGGVLLLPVHALDDAPRVLQAIHGLRCARRIPDLPVHLDHAIATEVLALHAAHADELRIGAAACRELLQGVHVAANAYEAAGLAARPGPCILVAVEDVVCSRALAEHLKRLAPLPQHAIAYCGWQPAGTRGAALLDGQTRIKVQGDWIPVRAEVQSLHGLNGHADRKDLLDWVAALPRAPRQIYLTPGEPAAADSLRQAIEERCQWPCAVPEHLEVTHVREPEALERQAAAG